MKWWWCLALLATGCVSPLAHLTVSRPVGTDYTVRSDGFIELDVKRVQAALEKAAPGLARWGGLEAPVTVYVVSSHGALEDAVRRHGFDWLRAWARYDDVIFQAPSTWAPPPDVLDQLVLHELTHCLLFQKSATRDDWMKKQIPLWFREGMAIATAQQHRLYPSLEDTAIWLTKNPGLDVFTDGEALSESQYAPVYGFALHAFVFLERRIGMQKLESLFSAMRAGADFSTAFDATTGTTLERFKKDFTVYLRLRGFRGGGRPAPLRARPPD